MKLQDAFSCLSSGGTQSHLLKLWHLTMQGWEEAWIGIKYGFCIQNVINNPLIPLWSILKSARYKICKVAENVSYFRGC